ncbi:hypothetical protein RO3G_16795 [Lichtheimia corymbifera JMRC:FSU:9682]|uniref:Uncharacterized protein n=1 Tax=Lichtheimia corymbifera JMRC:FSU:9682 TaxID=1263082 RepID=A0A068S7H2_9FUNG|nr:hypothetical protein RO3G_16795 [Lichtheimia corymbifera JMRC:FSU:9682]
MERRFISPFRTPYTDDDDSLSSRMSDYDGDINIRGDVLRRRRSSSVSLTASPCSQKMSIDSDDNRSVSSSSRQGHQHTFPPPRRLTRSLSSEYIPTSSSSLQQQQQQHHADEMIMADDSRMHHGKFIAPAPLRPPSSSSMRRRSLSSSSSSNEQHRHPRSTSQGDSSSPKRSNDPERRSVSRRSSLFPKSKALARVMNQADEETHLADMEMRRERDMTQQMRVCQGKGDMASSSSSSSTVPAAAWARIKENECSPVMAPYHASKLNPEMEMTTFQFENLPSPIYPAGHRSVKRKASEDRFEPYPASTLKRRAVSPSVSASGSPVLSTISSPPCSIYGSSPSSNAAARAQQKPGQISSSFNLQDASGGISRMSLSE